MLNVRASSLAFLLLAAPAPASAIPSHVRLLVHGVHMIEESSFGVGGWVVAPSVTAAPGKWLAVAGPRWADGSAWVELMAGAMVAAGEATPIIDLRASLRRFAPLTAWTNLQWLRFQAPADSSGYAFLMVDYVLPWKLFAAGVETENTFQPARPATLAAGPHLLVLFERLTFLFAYQFGNHVDRALWARLIVNP